MATVSLLCLRCSEDAMLGDFRQAGMAAVDKSLLSNMQVLV
jgi:hypothetical protein